MTARLAVFDTGLGTAARNLSLDRLARAECARTGQGSLRFHRYRPTASLGRHESAEHAIRAGWCRGRGIESVRRLTGGPAVYLDPDQPCFTLVLARADASRGLRERMSDGAAIVVDALSQLGIDAYHSPPHDIETAHKRVAGIFVDIDRETVLLQGYVAGRADLATMLKALRMPLEKLSPEGMRTARQRVATLEECGVTSSEWPDALTEALGRAGYACRWTAPPEEYPDPTFSPNAADTRHASGSSARGAFITIAGGVLHARVRADDANRRLIAAELTGSAHVYPSDLFVNLARRLAGAPFESVDDRILEFFEGASYELLGFGVEDLRRLWASVLARFDQERLFGLGSEQANTIMVHGSAAADDLVSGAQALLVPYCAKPTWCKWRHRDGCPDCGLCEVGEAYRLGRERGMRVHTITHYEHFRATLSALRADGVRSYIGLCCHHFYIKRAHGFAESGLPALLLDISGSNCYELQQEEAAYAGDFAAQARIDLDVLRKVLARAPKR